MTRTVFENAIEADGLVKRYGDVQALDGVDLHVEAGTVFGLLGPNGAGKSTTVRILTTLSRPDAGSVRVAGIDALKRPVDVRRAIGVVAQKHGTDPDATGRENLVLQAELYGVSRSRSDELLERFGLAEAADRQAKTYSGGMIRRLDVALGLIHKPAVLFLDEPTTGLDPRARNELWGVLDGLVGGGATILLTTQYLEEADRLADDIVVVDHGRIIARGDARSLKRRIGSDQLHVVVAADEHVSAAADILRRAAGAEPAVDAESRSITVSSDGGAAAIAAIAAELAEREIAVEDLGLRQPTLDDVFLTLTGAPTEEEPLAA
jgi:ABC-2 type transport system ATP-binding protein